MIIHKDWPIGLCSWSLKNNTAELSKLREETGIEHLHLDLNAVVDGNPVLLRYVEREKWQIAATMIGFPQEDYSTLASIRKTGGIVPDSFWNQNKKRVMEAVEVTKDIEVPFLEFHFGFIDNENEKNWRTLLERTYILADYAAARNVILLMETGQETALGLRHFIETINHPAIAVNFDPGNMILYGKGNPKESIASLSPWIKNVHLKDALHSEQSDEWGTETCWGEGEVEGPEFLNELMKIKYRGCLCVERECSSCGYEDITKIINCFKE